MNKIRICNVDEEGRFGGPERRIIQVARELVKFGVSTHIILPQMDADLFLSQIDLYHISRTQLDITRLSKERKVLIRYCFRYFIEIIILYLFFRKEKFDLIHVNGSYQIKGAIAAHLSRTPVVWHLNDTMMAGLVKSIFSYIARIAAKGFIVAGKRVYDYYISNTLLATIPCEEIHAPVDVTVFSPKPSQRILAKDWLTIVTVSGLNPTKGLEYFIRAAIQIHRNYPKVQFCIAGAELKSHKHYADSLKKIIVDAAIPRDTINFLGLVDDIPSLLSTADICVFTSVSEASPTSIWEALASGIPVVTTDVGAVTQYIQDGVSGFVVPIRDIDALVARIEILLNDAELRQSFGEKGRATAVQHLDITSAARKHLKIYQRILRLKS